MWFVKRKLWVNFLAVTVSADLTTLSGRRFQDAFLANFGSLPIHQIVKNQRRTRESNPHWVLNQDILAKCCNKPIFAYSPIKRFLASGSGGN